MKSRIPYTKPSITDLEISYATDAAANGWGDQCYAYIDRFEKLFKEYLGVNYAIATSSCTGALHMGMAALGIGLGDEVIMADTNWIATAAPIVHLGAKPVFVDILPDSWCIDPEKAEAAITPRTKAIVATHLYGNLCEMNLLIEVGDKYGIPIIEDSAEAIGSVYHGKMAGSMGCFGSFSFHGTKTLTTGEGGMFVTNNPDVYERALTLSNHGRSRIQVKQFWPDFVGYKYKMSNVQAAIGCAQVERVTELTIRKREVLLIYKRLLSDYSAISMNPEPINTVNGAWMPTAVFDPSSGIKRDNLLSAFKRADIDARVFFWPLSSLPMFTPVLSNTVAFDIPSRAINLPSFHDITKRQQEDVAHVIRDLFNA
jgi:perosamine synthetase